METTTESVDTTSDTMLYLGAQRERSFRCEGCGCNVFRRTARTDRLQYRCNGCGETYTCA
jgi:predicted RNA-binding Zn-ribbon protein involved in translation (DUF1610 family)